MIKVIAFDLDDTLWEVAPIIHRAEATLGAWLAQEVPQLAYNIETMRALRHEVLAQSPSLAGKITELRRRVIETAMIRSGVSPAEADQRSRNAMEVFLAARNQIELFDGALDAVSALAGQFILGALTNGNADIGRLGLGHLFSFAFCAEDVGAPKPADNLFRAALAHTGAQPHEMIYVGDDPALDVDPAKRTGLKTIWVRHSGKPPGETEPDATIPHVRHVGAAVEQLLQQD
ncbi:MAG: HAD-IA family hydrolase [Pseudomonadales bacterium]